MIIIALKFTIVVCDRIFWLSCADICRLLSWWNQIWNIKASLIWLVNYQLAFHRKITVRSRYIWVYRANVRNRSRIVWGCTEMI